MPYLKVKDHLRTLINHAIDKQERTLGASLDWIRDLASASLPALFKLALAGPLGNHRKRLPKEAWHIARLTTTLHEDCGGCVQIVVNLALRDGISADLLQAVLHGDIARMPDHLAQVHRFTKAVASGGDDSDLRENLRQRFGEEAFIELALAIATSRLIPTTKRALGYSQSCSLVAVKVRADDATHGPRANSAAQGA